MEKCAGPGCSICEEFGSLFPPIEYVSIQLCDENGVPLDSYFQTTRQKALELGIIPMEEL